MALTHLYDGAISATDGTPTSLNLSYTSGDFSISGLSETQRSVVKYETRGQFHGARYTSRTYPTGSFSFYLDDYSDAVTQTALDFFRRQGSYSGNVSTLGAAEEVYTLDLTLTMTEGANTHTISMTNCVASVDFSEGEPNQASISFEVLGTVTFS